ncbi:hypothetical protein LOK49_LG04G02427 [Camellia lanceoleosa]|uniref:Uncharacterized protein n=1 Tax=Camellia lanceoleosa TaxID=1840588 RepID=A0ACC0HXZ9_9ERIC|nr:hypothetical protein LOK49_LG04G02427 [Camellia lanceoleosa]
MRTSILLILRKEDAHNSAPSCNIHSAHFEKPGQLSTPRSLFNTPLSKRKRSPQPSVNSSTAENECPYPARMATDNDDFKMWGTEVVKIFLEILVEEIKKEGPAISKKDRSFLPRQWQTIDDEMTKRGAPTSDDEREMDERFHAYTSAKGVVDESCSSGSKRKSSGQGQSSKNPKLDEALQSWQRSCEARERYYAQAEANAGAADAYSVAACMTVLKSMALDPSLFLKAMNMFTSLEWRTMFITMEPELSCLADDLASHLNMQGTEGIVNELIMQIMRTA